jgi:hypothetical protein
VPRRNLRAERVDFDKSKKKTPTDVKGKKKTPNRSKNKSAQQKVVCYDELQDAEEGLWGEGGIRKLGGQLGLAEIGVI